MGNQKRGFRVLLDGSHLQAAPRRAKCCAGRGANGKVASDRINRSLTSTTASFSTGSAEREGSDRAELGRADEAVEPRGRRKRAAASRPFGKRRRLNDIGAVCATQLGPCSSLLRPWGCSDASGYGNRRSKRVLHRCYGCVRRVTSAATPPSSAAGRADAKSAWRGAPGRHKCR